ncbi:DUF4858 domain-containing protein [Candidatus Bacteroides intestinigallinarum]|nr:DUF4858 domain-containing protein [Candidatus Bacteroides intestinigallinarum]
MDIRKYQINIFCLLLFPLAATGQEWNKQDSLRLQQILESGQEIKINRKFIEKVEQNMYSRKPFVDFDPTLPTLKSSMIFFKTFHSHLSDIPKTRFHLFTHLLLVKNKQESCAAQ